MRPSAAAVMVPKVEAFISTPGRPAPTTGTVKETGGFGVKEDSGNVAPEFSDEQEPGKKSHDHGPNEDRNQPNRHLFATPVFQKISPSPPKTMTSASPCVVQ